MFLVRNSTLHSHYSTHVLTIQALSAWRDRIAREEDESVRYVLNDNDMNFFDFFPISFVLPDHMMFELADQLPRDTQQVCTFCGLGLVLTAMASFAGTRLLPSHADDCTRQIAPDCRGLL